MLHGSLHGKPTAPTAARPTPTAEPTNRSAGHTETPSSAGLPDIGPPPGFDSVPEKLAPPPGFDSVGDFWEQLAGYVATLDANQVGDLLMGVATIAEAEATRRGLDTRRGLRDFNKSVMSKTSASST